MELVKKKITESSGDGCIRLPVKSGLRIERST